MKFKNIKSFMAAAILTMTLPFTSVLAQTSTSISEEDAYEIGIEAYVYLHPIITMDVTRRVLTNLPDGVKEGIGPMNIFHHSRTFPAADMRSVVRPNFDTLYSSAWLDITKEPVIITIPDTKDRHYILPIYDMWTDVIVAAGKRTSGTKAGNIALVPKGFNGKLPKGVEAIESTTPYVWIINRIQTNGPKDYKFVNGLQDGLKITPLSQWGNKEIKIPFKADPTVDMKKSPYDQVTQMKAEQYFSYGAELMKMHSPHATDYSIIQRMKRIGIVAGKSFEFDKASPTIQKALKRANVDGLELMKELIPTVSPITDGWATATDTIGVYGNSYMKRAIITLVGLGAIPPEDAIYPLALADADGAQLVGTNNYLMHFDKDKLPPVDAFWSITMYDEEGFQVANKINRFAIGDRDDLTFNKDGSLDIYMQASSPGKNKESNWLPSPDKDVLGITMRLYAPKVEALDGRWTPPAIKKVN